MTTPIIVTGFEHGLSTFTTNGGGICAAIIGSPTCSIAQKHSGSYSLKIETSSATQHLSIAVPSTPTLIVGRLYFYIHTAPAAGTDIFSLWITGGSHAFFHFTDGAWRFGWTGTNTDPAVSGVAINNDTWVRVDFLADVGVNPRTLDWSIDHVAQTQATRATATSTFQYIRLGTTTTSTQLVYFDDLVVTDISGDYPLDGGRDGGVELLKPGSDGAHSAGVDIMEDNAGADIGAVTAFDLINSIPPSATAYIRQAGDGAGNYAEVNFEDISAPHSAIIGAQAYLSYTSATTTANKGACEISKDAWASKTVLWGEIGGVTADMSDGSTANLYYKNAIVADVINDTTVNALQARVGGSDDADPDPYWIDIWIEVAYTEATESASVSPSESPSISPSESPSVSPSESPSISPSASGSASESPSESPSVSPSIPPEVTPCPVVWGQDTGVSEPPRDFAGNWSGTGAITGIGDAERIELDAGEYMESEVIQTGTVNVWLGQNVYQAGDNVAMFYRHGNTEAACLLAVWNAYVGIFASLGYVQIRLESTL